MPDGTRAHPLAAAFQRQKHLDRFIVHLRQQCTARNLNLVVGAGATTDAGTPQWGELIRRLRKKMIKFTDLKKDHLESFGYTMAASVLLKWLDARIKDDDEYKKHKVPQADKEYYVKNRWNTLIKDAMYRNVPPDAKMRFRKHKYLEDLAYLVSNCPLTINFNFDDIVDMATQAVCAIKGTELPNIVWRLPFGYQHKGATILHINGFLSSSGKSHSEHLVLTEGAFAELMMQQTDYQSVALLRAFAETTVMVIGCSMEDTSLKAILRASSQINPANYHYVISFLGDDDRQTDEHLERMFEVNRETYNLITIFLRRDEYRPFLNLISRADASTFHTSLKELNPGCRSRLLFYIVGAVGSGKTTLIKNLRLFRTYEEWGAQPPKEMYRDSRTLTSDERKKVDDFLKPQMRRKNQLMQSADIGYHVMDRAFLDLIAFSNNNGENAAKLQMLETFVAGEDGFSDGVTIMLTATPSELERGQWSRGLAPKRFGGDGFTLKTLRQQQELLKAIYTPCRTVERVSGKSAAMAARDVAFEILTAQYEPISFQDRIDRIKSGCLASMYGRQQRGVTSKKRKNRRTPLRVPKHRGKLV
jgi:hypothetical protein